MRFPLKETVMTGVCVTILCGLGTWQIKRLHWKDTIIDRLNAEYEHKNQGIESTRLAALAVENAPIAYGTVEGRLLRDSSLLLGPRPEEGRMGYHLLVPLLLEDGHTLIVNAGWVNDLWQDNIEDRLTVLPAGEIRIRGIIRKPDWSALSSKNSPANDLWFRADINEIGAAKELKNVYPFILYADRAEPELHDITPHEDRWLPRNKHLQYAIFWYALATVMLGVYGIYVSGLNRKPVA